jgi:hypothetical protein
MYWMDIHTAQTLHLRPSQAGQVRMSTWELIKSPGVGRVIFIYNFILFLAFAFTAVVPVFLYTPVDLGGIGFKPELIAAAIGLNGVAQAIWLLVPFPLLQRRIGTVGVFRLCAMAWPVFFAIYPISNTLLRHGMKVAFWCIGPFSLAVGSGVAMAFSKFALLQDVHTTN